MTERVAGVCRTFKNQITAYWWL